MKSPDRELRRLTDAWHDGTISPEDGMRLEQRLCADDSGRRYFFEIAEIETSMTEAASILPSAIPVIKTASQGIWWKMATVFWADLPFHRFHPRRFLYNAPNAYP
jgi:hypothetical protein